MYNEKECYVMAKLEAKRIKQMCYNAPRKLRYYFRDYYREINDGIFCNSYSNSTNESIAHYFIDVNKNKLSFEYKNLIGSVELTPSICKKICEVIKNDGIERENQ